MQEHALRRHLGVKSCLDVIHKGLAVRAVHPDALPKGVLNVNLKEKKATENTNRAQAFLYTFVAGIFEFPKLLFIFNIQL